MESVETINSNMAHAYGTQAYHRLSLLHRNLVTTDGVAQLCLDADCYWLMDAISSHQSQCMANSDLSTFQIWELTVSDDVGILQCKHDSGEVAVTQEIEYTDFPLDSIKIWIIPSGFQMVAMLPGEY